MPPEKNSSLRSLQKLSSREIAQAIFKGDVPEQMIRQLPAQTLYLVAKQNGIGSSGDLIEFAQVEQIRLLLDFDLWKQDTFDEESFWEWLAVHGEDEDNGLEITQKILKCIDLKLISLIIARYVQIVVNEEPSDAPPAPGYFTPDKGSTWIGFSIEDGTKQFQLGRLLALIFETKAELFYQLIAVAQTQTQTILEEESYLDKQRRLSGEGIPDSDYAHAVHLPLSRDSALQELSQEPARPALDIPVSEPLLYIESTLQPLVSLAEQYSGDETFESELTLIMNSALVVFHINFNTPKDVFDLTAQVRGALNIGLHVLTQEGEISADDLYRKLGLQKIYRVGFTALLDLQKRARKMLRIEQNGAVPTAILEKIASAFPRLPVAIDALELLDKKYSSAEHSTGSYSQECVPFTELKEVMALRKILTA
jgi:hypothetical protein